MKKLNVGIIGLGVGEAHIEGYAAHKGCQVTTLCDFDSKKRKEASQKYPKLAIVEKAEELLGDPAIDVVSIASYDSDHYAQIIQAIEQGKHIFVEKPVCTEPAQAKHIRSLLREHPKIKLSSNLILRKYPRLSHLRKMVQLKELGSLFLIEGDYNYGRIEKITEGWRGKLDFYSVVNGGGVHIIDLFQWLTGDKIIEVSAYGNQIASAGSQFKFNDLVVAILKFKSGLIGKMSVNFGCVYPHFHRVSLYGTKGTFVNEPEGSKTYRSRDPKLPPEEGNDPYPGAKKGEMIYNFVESIIGNAKPDVSVDEVFQAMSVCFAIERATKEKGPVQVEYI